MYGTSVQSKAQHDLVDEMISEAEGQGIVVDGFIFDNALTLYGEQGTLRAVLVIGDEVQTYSTWDRLFSFEGELLASGEGLRVREDEVQAQQAAEMQEFFSLLGTDPALTA